MSFYCNVIFLLIMIRIIIFKFNQLYKPKSYIMKKLILFLLAFIPITVFSQSFYECGCTIGGGTYFSIVITYWTTTNTSCATPSPGAALSQLYIAGQVQDSGYVDNQDAANQCQVNQLVEFLEV